MTTPRPLLLAALLLGACGSPRGNGGALDLDTDAATATDASTTPSDVVSPIDTGTPLVDVGTPPVDAGSPPVDVGTPPVDVGTPPVDVGTPPVDVGVAPVDVGTPPVDVPRARCGDGICDEGESCESCRADCASTCPPPPPDVPATRCGDGTCNGVETCASCAGDCGACGTPGSPTDACAAGVEQGPARNCGWRPGTTFSCSPGRATMVGCSGESGVGSLCQPSYGACAGDPVMRVCPGTTPCVASAALAPAAGNLDDQCGACPSVYVTCPASGQIHVLTGDFDSNVTTQRGTCMPAVR